MGMVSKYYALLVSMGMVQDLYTIHFIYHGNGTRFVHCTTLKWAGVVFESVPCEI